MVQTTKRISPILGFKSSIGDLSLFIMTSLHTIYILVLVYVDDVIITGSDEFAIRRILDSLGNKFKLHDLDNLNYFLGFQVKR